MSKIDHEATETAAANGCDALLSMEDAHFCLPERCPCPKGVAFRAEAQRRITACRNEVLAVLDKYACRLDGVPALARINGSTAFATVVSVEIVPK